MGLAILILGLVVFIGAHVFVTRRAARAALIARIGEGPYKGLFSLVSIIGVVLIAYGFGQYRAGRLHRAVESAGLDAPPHGAAGVAGDHLLRARPIRPAASRPC